MCPFASRNSLNPLALAFCHGRGRGFEPRRPRHILKKLVECGLENERTKDTSAGNSAIQVLQQQEGSRRREPFPFAGTSVIGVFCCREKQAGHGTESVPRLLSTGLLVDLQGDARVRMVQLLLDRLHIFLLTSEEVYKRMPEVCHPTRLWMPAATVAGCR
jgi:hypothetical protein